MKTYSPITQYYHENFYPDMDIEEVDNHIMGDQNVFNNAIDYLHQNHYNDMPIGDFVSTLDGGIKPYVAKNQADYQNRLKAYNDSLTLHIDSYKQLGDLIKDPNIKFNKEGLLLDRTAPYSNSYSSLMTPPSQKYLQANYALGDVDPIRTIDLYEKNNYLGSDPKDDKIDYMGEVYLYAKPVQKVIPSQENKTMDILHKEQKIVPKTRTQKEINEFNKKNKADLTGPYNSISKYKRDIEKQQPQKGRPTIEIGEPTMEIIPEDSPKKFYQGRDFMRKYGLRPGWYTEEELNKNAKR